MLDRLTDSFNGLFRKLSGNATLTEKNVRDAIDEVKTNLLDADVHLDVVNAFTAAVLQDALGKDVTKSLKPGEEMIGIVHARLVQFLGGTPDQADPRAALQSTADQTIMKVSPGPTIIMMCGLQGSGKTTTCGKLAALLKKRGRSVMLAAADLQRPAAVEQLHTVANQVEKDFPGGSQVHFYGEPDKVAEYGKAVGIAVQVCQRALAAARAKGVDVLILDTAGRLHVNDELMGELTQVKRLLNPHHIFLVVDAMTGQDALNSAKSFHEKLDIDGVILTKFDSDTRGGAAMSVKHVTGAPIKFVGVGEKLDALEDFHPTRFAGRILGMGDVVALVEKAQEQVNEDEAKKLEEKLAKGELTMDDFLSQLKMLRRMGPLKQLFSLLPGVGSMLKDVQIEDKQLDKVEAMIGSMNKAERKKPDIIDNSRRKRIASGAGVEQNDVGQMVKQFGLVSKLSKGMAGMSAAQKSAAARELGSGGMGGMIPGLKGLPGFGSKGSSFSASPKAKFKKRKK
ncbi:MAG: signal recognition particle protein [Planctomycetes bacterium]|nr:signal recognition particle protein [Planctomycetota bacterium]